MAIIRKCVGEFQSLDILSTQVLNSALPLDVYFYFGWELLNLEYYCCGTANTHVCG